jgi:two-component system chemotaxis family response regulator WspR
MAEERAPDLDARSMLECQSVRIERLGDDVEFGRAQLDLAHLAAAQGADRAAIRNVIPLFESAAARDDATEVRRLQEEIQRLRAIVAQRDDQIAELKEKERRDPLTSCLDRRSFDDALLREWARGMRAEVNVGLLFIDVDNFKRVNDDFGHLAGDAALVEIARAIEEQARRSGELVARYGGDEFACVVPGADLAATLAIGERIRTSVAELRLTSPSADGRAERVIALSVSIGGASAVPAFGIAAAHLVGLADKAAYAAKDAGRNRTVGWDGEAYYAPLAPETLPAAAADRVTSLSSRRGR